MIRKKTKNQDGIIIQHHGTLEMLLKILWGLQIQNESLIPKMEIQEKVVESINKNISHLMIELKRKSPMLKFRKIKMDLASKINKSLPIVNNSNLPIMLL